MERRAMSDRKPRRRKSEASKPEIDVDLLMIDRRGMEKMMAEIGKLLNEQQFNSADEANAFLQRLMGAGELPGSSAAETPLEQAQELMYDAWNASGKRRVELARRALELSK